MDMVFDYIQFLLKPDEPVMRVFGSCTITPDKGPVKTEFLITLLQS